MIMTTGNRGEWSEAYVFLKLLAEGILYAADRDLNKISTIVYPIVKILRSDAEQDLEYKPNGLVKVVDARTSDTLAEFSIADVGSWAKTLLSAIRDADGRSFEVPDIAHNLSSMRFNTLKASSSDKRDITIVVHDFRTGYDPTLGFSIKSMLGSPSTLLNPGKTTNFVFEIIGREITQSDLDVINAIDSPSKLKDRIKKIFDMGLGLTYRDIESEIFELNLRVIDSKMPEIVAEMLVLFHKEGKSQVSDLIERLSVENPLDFVLEHSHRFYEYKVKSLLTDIALGMTPSKVWGGSYDATGGYIIVKKDGEVVCYHVYNKNEFQEYLVGSTRLDTASTLRYGYGAAYMKGLRAFIKLNLQIRFKE